MTNRPVTSALLPWFFVAALRIPGMRRAFGWFCRYFPAEVSGTLGALLAAGVAFQLTGSAWTTALAGALGETLGFYAPLIWREARSAHMPASLRTWLHIARNLGLEFGLAEILDSFVVRPGLMLAALTFLGSSAPAVLVGKIAADLFFYVTVVAGYELRLRCFAGRE